jgi:hypothetical protein
MKKISLPVTACKQYCLAAGAKQGNIAYTQNVIGHFKDDAKNKNRQYETTKIYYDNYHFDKFVCL